MQNDVLQFNEPKSFTPREQLERNRQFSRQPFPGIQHWFNLQGFIKTVTTAPTVAPKTISDQVVIYVDDLASPTTKRLYIYSREAAAWFYVALT